jgi:MYXO-CTERM domain-containing protein
MNKINKAVIAAAAALAFTPGAVLAQNDSAYNSTTTTDTAINTQYSAPAVEDDDDDFPWGLLGLLGLAGLLGLKRKDNDIHVDARRDTRP